MSSDWLVSDEDLHAYVDGALDPQRRSQVAHYLESNPEVARRVRAFVDQREQLQSLFGPIAEEPIPARLRLAHLVQMRARVSFPRWGAMAAAIMLTCLGGTGGWVLREAADAAPSGLSALAQEAADSYKVFGSDYLRPVELRADDSQQLQNWLSQRLGRPISIPNLTNVGYRFMGGRLLPSQRGPAGLLMYDNNQGVRLALFIRNMQVDQSNPVSQQMSGDVTGFAWSNKGLGCSIAGAVDPETLQPIAKEVRRQMIQSTSSI